MPIKTPRICGCGHRIASGARCPCEARRAKERKARADANRPSAAARGYDREWQREARAFLAANPSCRRCGALAAVVDHIEPHRGNKALFWSRTNWQPLCRNCHASWKQASEARTHRGLR